MPHRHELGIVLAWLGLELGYEFRFYQNPAQELITSDDIEKVLIGMKLGASDQTNINLSRGKSSYELGRAMAFAIRVRGYYRRNKFLTESALRQDNFFFGNHPTEKVGLYPVVFRLKALVASLSQVKTYTTALFKVLTHLLEEYNLRDCTEEILETIIKSSLISIQAVEERHYHKTEVTTGKGKKLRTVTELRGPKKPSTSPLFLKEESKFIQDLLTPIYECTAAFHDIGKFLEAIKRHTFRKVTSYVRDVYEVRWHILQEYASLTTKRLGEVRCLESANSQKKKATVTKGDLVSLLSQRSFPGEKFAIEVAKLIPRKIGYYLQEMDFKLPEAWFKESALVDLIAAFFRNGITSEKIVWRVPFFPEGQGLPGQESLVGVHKTAPFQGSKTDFPSLDGWKTVPNRPVAKPQ
jgi:hypothetical protein